jgi:hypothetical protein
MATITPGDASPDVCIEVLGDPLIATGLPSERIPGVAQLEGSTAEICSELLHQSDSNLPPAELYSAVSAVLDDAILTSSRVEYLADLRAHPSCTGDLASSLDALLSWSRARLMAPDRVLFGDQVGNGEFDPFVDNSWVLLGLGGASVANAEIILELNPEACVTIVGTQDSWVLRNDAQYLSLRRQYDRQHGGNGRLQVYAGHRIGQIHMSMSRGRRPQFGTGHWDAGALVACLGRNVGLPSILSPLQSWVSRQGGDIRSRLLVDSYGQYLGYHLQFEATGRVLGATVIGAASRSAPSRFFTAQQRRDLALHNEWDAPAESGNVATGFMASVVQAARFAAHEKRLRTP